MQIGLCSKPGPQEPWTPYRMAEAFFFQAGVPRGSDLRLILAVRKSGGCHCQCERTMIFGGLPTVERYHGNPRVQVHGPGFQQDHFRRRRGRQLGKSTST